MTFHFIEEMINNPQRILMKVRAQKRWDTQQKTHANIIQELFFVNQLNSDIPIQSLHFVCTKITVYSSELKHISLQVGCWKDVDFPTSLCLARLLLSVWLKALLRTVEKTRSLQGPGGIF